MVYSNTIVYGGNEYGKSSHLSICTSLKQLMVLWKCNIFRASFWHLIKDTNSIKGQAPQVETLNNAFNPLKTRFEYTQAGGNGKCVQ